MKDAAESLLGVLNDILDFSKIEAGKLSLDAQPFSLRACVETLMKVQAVRGEAKGLAVTWQVGADTPDGLVGDAGRLRQIIANLVSNAIKFTDRGTVTVTVGCAPAADAVVATDASAVADVRLHLCVADTGIGIAAAKQAAIFEAFEQADGSTTRKYGGTGLGLAISAKLVALLGGRIWVESEIGRGSAFHVVVPVGRAASEIVAVRPNGWRRSTERPLEILLAEDHPVNQLVARRVLERQGHTVTIVSNGRAALEAVQRRRFDVVLMDVQMPEMDGLEATAAIRAAERRRGGHVHIVAMTAHAMKGDRERCLAAGMDGYVSKPVQAEELRDALQDILESAA